MRIRTISSARYETIFDKMMGRAIPATKPGESITGDFVQTLTYDSDDLLISISNLLKIHDYEVEQSQGIVGRIVGMLSGKKDPDWQDVDGTRLLQLHQLAKQEPEFELSASQIYSVEVVGLRAMLKKVRK